jgi:hypothetical protein
MHTEAIANHVGRRWGDHGVYIFNIAHENIIKLSRKITEFLGEGVKALHGQSFGYSTKDGQGVSLLALKSSILEQYRGFT